MIPDNVIDFLAGAAFMGYAASGVFFLRFWSRTRDSLFLTFAFAFWLLALNAALPALLGVPKEEQSPFFLLRLAAFVLIIIAVARKNLGGRD
jgi:hypothetical protein